MCRAPGQLDQCYLWVETTMMHRTPEDQTGGSRSQPGATTASMHIQTLNRRRPATSGDVRLVVRPRRTGGPAVGACWCRAVVAADVTDCTDGHPEEELRADGQRPAAVYRGCYTRIIKKCACGSVISVCMMEKALSEAARYISPGEIDSTLTRGGDAGVLN